MIPDECKFELHCMINGAPRVMDAVIIQKEYSGGDGYKVIGYTLLNRDRIYHKTFIESGVFTYINNVKEYAPTKTDFPEKDATLYVAPECPVPIADIRKNYKIKRTITDADYIVVNPKILQNDHWYGTTDFGYVFPDNNFVLLYYDVEALYFLNTSNTCKQVSGLNTDAVDALNKKYDLNLSYNYNKVSPKTGFTLRVLRHGTERNIAFLKALEAGIQGKTFVSYTNLVLGSCVPMDMETVSVFHSAASRPYSRVAEENFNTSLAALNQTTWRDYTGTLSRVLRSARSGGYTVASQLYLSSLSKAARVVWDVIDNYNVPFKNKEDYEMYTSWMHKNNGLDKTSFFTQEQFKEAMKCLPAYDVDNFYSVCIRVRPKTYEEYAAEHLKEKEEDEE